MKSVKKIRKRAGAGVAAIAMATAMMMSSMPVYAAGEAGKILGVLGVLDKIIGHDAA